MPRKPAEGYKEKRAQAREMRKEPTLGEQVMWRHLRCDNMGFRFRRQHPIGPYILDFYCPAKQVAVEIDGELHDPVKDNVRDAFLLELGIKTVRVSSRAVLDDWCLREAMDRIWRALHEREDGSIPGPDEISDPRLRKGP